MDASLNKVQEVRSKSTFRVLAVLPHFGCAAQSQRAIAALVASRLDGLEVLVVDNSTSFPQEGQAAGVSVQRPGRNIGYCAAVNVGLRRAVKDGIPFLCLINGDVVVAPDCIRRLLEGLVADESAAGVTPLLTTGDGKLVWSAGSYLRFGPNEVKHRAWLRPVEKAPMLPAEVHFIPGALALYRTKDLESLGGIDESYFMYGEDVDLGHRLRRQGRRLLYLPWASAEHVGSSSSGGGVSPLRKFLMGVNTPRFLKRLRSPRLWFSFVLFDMLGLLPAMLLHLAKPKSLRSDLAKARGIWKGLIGYDAGAKDVEAYLGTSGSRSNEQ